MAGGAGLAPHGVTIRLLYWGGPWYRGGPWHRVRAIGIGPTFVRRCFAR